MLPLLPKIPPPCVAAVSAWLLAAPQTAPAQDLQDPVIFDEIPDRFVQRQDSLGFFWQADQYGALTSGETQYLASGLRLAANGQDFEPTEAALATPAEGSAELVLKESRSGLRLERSLYFDLERNGVRVLDTIRNVGGSELTVPVEFRTTYPFAWQNLFGTQGLLLDNDPVPTLGERDSGITIKFSQAEGRPDTIILAAGTSPEATKPTIDGSSNRRELILRYELKIPAGGAQSVLHWILQRNLGAASDAETEIARFYQKRRLILPHVPEVVAAQSVNFAADAFPKSGSAPANLAALFDLNRLTDKIGILRRSEDVLWVSQANQLVGQVNPAASVTMETRFAGDVTFPITRLAAIQGQGGAGVTSRVFLRDGQVFAGKLTAENLSLKVGDEWNVDSLRPEELSLLLLSLSPDDGSPPQGADSFLSLHTGSVMALAANGKVTLPVVHSWGREEIPLNEIEELRYLSSPVPRYRLVRPGGTRMNVFLPSRTLELALAGGGTITVPTTMIKGMRDAELTRETIEELTDFWMDFSEVPEAIRPATGFLLKGNNLIAGSIGETTLSLVDNDSAIDIATTEILSLKRKGVDNEAAIPIFEIELRNGDLLTGRISSTEISIRYGDETWTVPTAHLLAYRAG